MPVRAGILRGFVFNRAAVRLRLWCRDRLAGQRLLQRRLHVVSRSGNVRRVWGSFAVNCAAVNDFSFWIDDHHVWRVFSGVSAAGVTFGIQEKRGLMCLPRTRDLLRLFRRQVSFCAGRIGIDGQPDNTLVRELFLQVLHVAAAIMLFHERALGIKPLKDDVFTLVLRQRMRLATGIRKRKLWRSAAHGRRLHGERRDSDE